MRTLLAALAALPLLIWPTPAHADTPGEVTPAEYVAVQDGWRRVTVHDRFDTAGYAQSEWSGGGYQRQLGFYDTTYTDALVWVWYRRTDDADLWRVYRKQWCDPYGCVTG